MYFPKQPFVLWVIPFQSFVRVSCILYYIYCVPVNCLMPRLPQLFAVDLVISCSTYCAKPQRKQSCWFLDTL